MSSIQLNPIHVGWVGFSLNRHGGLNKKIPSAQPIHTLGLRLCNWSKM